MESCGAKKKIEKAYFDMLKTTHYSKITVSDLIRNSDVSRTTFYRYYVDIFDLHKKVAVEFADEIIKKCFGLIVTAETKGDYFDKITEVFFSQKKYIMLISGENGSRYFFESIYFRTVEFFNSLSIVLSDDQIFRLKFLTIALIGVYVKDIIENREQNPEYIEICKKLISLDDVAGAYNGYDC